jgi:acetolactate synthase I/II/III large subunit
MNQADLFVKALSGTVDLAFGVPGGAIEPLYDALHRAEQRGEMRLITTRHESAAVTMAEGAFRASGRLALCCATTGPGALNMVTALASALEECKPVLAVTAQTAQARFGRGALQDSSDVGIDTTAVLAKVCKYSTTVTHPAQLLPKLRQALAHAMSAPRGPVHLSVPADVFKAPIDEQLIAAQLAAISRVEDSVGAPLQLRPSQLAQLATHFERAQRPVLVLGEEATEEMPSILQFLARMNWPVVTTAAGHGAIDTDHPCYRGVVGFAGHSTAAATVAGADAVLVLGSHYRDLCVAATPALLDGRAMHIAPTSKSFAATVEGTLAIQACIASALAVVGAAAAPQALLQRVDVRPVLGELPFPAPPAALNAVMNALALPLRGFFDAGNAWSWSLHYLPANEQLESIRAMGLGQMAWAIPAAIGAAVADHDTRSVCVTGDGSWLMCSHELSVAVQQRIPVVFVILNDCQLGMVKHGQAMGGAEPAGFHLPAVDFSQLARAQGAVAIRVSTRDDLSALSERLREAAGGPVVIELMVDPDFAPPMAERVRQLKEAQAS